MLYMAQYYDGSFSCSNCGWAGAIQIEKGTRLEDAVDEMACPNCGCDDTLTALR